MFLALFLSGAAFVNLIGAFWGLKGGGLIEPFLAFASAQIVRESFFKKEGKAPSKSQLFLLISISWLIVVLLEAVVFIANRESYYRLVSDEAAGLRDDQLWYYMSIIFFLSSVLFFVAIFAGYKFKLGKKS